MAGSRNAADEGISTVLFCLLMEDVSFAPLTKLLHLKTILELFFVLLALVSNAFALRTFEVDEIIL